MKRGMKLRVKRVDKRMNNRGQFYLVAAIIIVMILAGIASIKTYAIAKAEPRKIKDISSELKEETTRIIDYGIYSAVDLPILLERFDNEFSEYFLKKTEETNIIFVYGNNKDGIYSVQYDTQYTGAVVASIGAASPTWEVSEPIVQRDLIDSTEYSDGILTVTILERNFEFEIKDGEVFYFLITQQRDDETFIEKN